LAEWFCIAGAFFPLSLKSRPEGRPDGQVPRLLKFVVI